MKKKILFVLLFIALLGLTGCGNNNEDKKENNFITASKKVTIITQDEKKEELLTAKELKEIYDSNQAKFNKKYKGAYVSFVGTVSSVKSYFRYTGDSTTYDSITFEEGFTLHLPYDVFDIVSEIDKGDLVYVKSNLYSMFGAAIRLQGTGGGTGTSDLNMLQTIVAEVNETKKEDLEELVKVLEEEVKLYNSLYEFEYDLDVVLEETDEIIPSFSSSFLEDINNSFVTEIDYSLLEERYPGVEEKINGLKDSKKKIYDFLVKASADKEYVDIPSYKSANTEADNAIRIVQDLMKEIR